MFAPPMAKPKSSAPQRRADTSRTPSSHITPRESLQRTIGNQPVLRPRDVYVPGLPPSSAELKIGAVDDPLEHEADRVADQIMRMPAPEASVADAVPEVSRKCPAREEEDKLRRKPAGTQATSSEAPASVHEVLRSLGQPLDVATRAYMEPRFGHDFSSVRVHTDARAAGSARDVEAHAYTVGQNMVFGAGRFAPGTHEGRRLIAHELTHVMQQSNSGEPRVGQGNEKRELLPVSHHGDTSHVQRFVPCEQASLSLQPCPPRGKDEVAKSKTDPMTLHEPPWLSDYGDGINDYLVVGFEVGSSAIKPGLREKLVNLMRGSNVQWKIQGLSDCSGSKDLNEGLRKARAEAVYNLLPEDVRKHVVSRESVPLNECITGNQNTNDRTVNRSVLLEQVGRTVVSNPEEEDVIEGHHPEFVCGPDVTRQVAGAVALAGGIFQGWTRSQRNDACNALIDMLGVAECAWDIVQINLHNNEWISEQFQPKKCATAGADPRCGESIQVNDECYLSRSVNYVIFGTMFKLCSDESPDISYDFSRSNMRALIDLYKGSGKSGLATPAPNFRASLGWASAGYDGWPSGGSPPSGDRNNCVPMCPWPYSGSFDIHWYPHLATLTCGR